MRNKILAILLVLISSNALAQKYIGIKGAYTMSNIKLSPYTPTKKLFGYGYDYGIMYKQYDSKFVGLQAELHITNRGYRQEINDTLKIDNQRVNTYIELPAFMQFRVNAKVAYLHVNIGPYFSYLLKAQEGNNQTGSFELSEYELNIIRDNRFDYGIAAGIGLSHDFKFGSIQIEGRYSFGLGDLFNVDYPDNPSQSPVRFQSVIISYCYMFGE